MSESINIQELLLKDRVNKIAIRQLIRLYGTWAKLFRSAKDEFSRVYGVESGQQTSEFVREKVLITGDTFAPMDRNSASLLQDGWLYTSKEDVVKVGDLVEVARKDGRAFKFKITSRETLGVTESVVVRYKIAAQGENKKP